MEKFLQRPLSWSSLSSFIYDKEQWYNKYILGIEDPATLEMIFGKKLADELEKGCCTIPSLVKLLPYRKEYPFKVMFNNIPLIGFADDFDDKTYKILNEVKTGKKSWDQKRVNEHGQITMYVLMNYITHKIKPEEVVCRLHWLPTQQMGDFTIDFVKPIKVHSFTTKRTMADIIKFGKFINETYQEMIKYIEYRLSTTV